MQEPQRQPSSRSVVIFDLDGTITKPDLNFDAIRAEIGVEGPILEAMARMTPEGRERAGAILIRYEGEAAARAELHDGAIDVVRQVRAAGFPVAILTRNSRVNANAVLTRFGIEVDAIRSRDDGAVKPAPDGVLSICAEFAVSSEDSWMVGDYLFDIQAGRAAGAKTVLMMGDRPRPDFAGEADHAITSLADLLPIVGIATA